MQSSLCAVRNTILENLSSLPLKQREKASILGISQQMISYLLQKTRLGIVLKLKKVGAKPRLSPEQLGTLATFLSKGAEFYEFEGDFWTQKRVKYVIEKEYGVVYEVKQVGRLLKKIGWTLQKPQKKDNRQSAEKVAKWETETLPNLKKKP